MFYTFAQNNSGGQFILKNNKISEYVIIEADSDIEANKKAEDIGIYFDGCDKNIECDYCCGDRWYRADSYDGKNEPLIYGESPEFYKPYTNGMYCIIYYKNRIVQYGKNK